MHQFLILAATLVVYVFGGGFTCGLLAPDNSDDSFWCFIFWPVILLVLGILGGIGLLGWCGFKSAKFLRGLFN